MSLRRVWLLFFNLSCAYYFVSAHFYCKTCFKVSKYWLSGKKFDIFREHVLRTSILPPGFLFQATRFANSARSFLLRCHWYHIFCRCFTSIKLYILCGDVLISFHQYDQAYVSQSIYHTSSFFETDNDRRVNCSKPFNVSTCTISSTRTPLSPCWALVKSDLPNWIPDVSEVEWLPSDPPPPLSLSLSFFLCGSVHSVSTGHCILMAGNGFWKPAIRVHVNSFGKSLKEWLITGSVFGS